MATIKYQCNVCKRIIQKLENINGITVFAKCIITDGCLGNLNKLDRNLDNNRESFPVSISGLIDYTPRKALFTHNQNTAAKSWIVNHNLRCSPAVSVYSEDNSSKIVQLDPDKFTVVIIDQNNLRLEFDNPVKGIIQCVARTVNNRIKSNKVVKTQTRITNNGIITLAIPQFIINPANSMTINMDNLNFNVELTVKKPSETEVSSLENITAKLDSKSPWIDFPKILVRNRKNYLVRTKNILDFFIFGSNIKATDIPNGTKFKFRQIVFPSIPSRFIESKEVLFLLSNSPFSTIDKIKNKVLDVGEIINGEIDFLTYRDGDLYIDTDLIEITYPDIRKV